ncbi:hypothetical protein PsorP6_008705 [Peronosclerospora sorghi]|uniref:Uncharacterized protein n=1 Tax=Peronosclerospora sorghi TaxID=230839 RepID=A0ACC0W0H2_9STRA|nr:hypothetical protein PsorP6_008705 [Peronosclerospora sorghi]
MLAFLIFLTVGSVASLITKSDARCVTSEIKSSADSQKHLGTAYGTAKSGVYIASMGVMRPELAMRNIVPVVMAGVLGIYGLIVAVVIKGSIDPPNGNAPMYGSYYGFAHLSAGLFCGLSGLAAGIAISVVGDAGVRPVGQQENLFVNMILILIFAKALGLYGFIVALILLWWSQVRNRKH